MISLSQGFQRAYANPSYGVGGEGLGEGGRGHLRKSPWAPLPRLVLIGTVHGDPQGYDRAWRLFDYLRPDLITVEISPYSLRYRQRYLTCWQRLLRRALAELPAGAPSHGAIQRLAAQVALPFEAGVARDWSRRYGISWRPLDLGAPARRHLPRYAAELLSPDNLRALLTTPHEALADFVASEFGRARQVYRRSPWRLVAAAGREILARERHLVRRLRRLACRYRRVVHLGGWEHLVPWQDLSGLWHGLAALQPGRLLLDEADRLESRAPGTPSRDGLISITHRSGGTCLDRVPEG